MDILKALELEAKIAEVLRNEIPNLYITLRSGLDGSVMLIVRECPLLNLKP